MEAVKIEKISKAFGLNLVETKDVLDRMDSKKWLGGESLSSIVYAGVIDDDSEEKIYGHTGFWIANLEGNINVLAHNNDENRVGSWTEYDEDFCLYAGVKWGEMEESLKPYRV